MYALRKRRTNSYLKLNSMPEEKHSTLVFADHCIELNYYVNSSLGFIASILKQEGNPSTDYCPIFDDTVNPQELEVYDLLNSCTVPLDVVFDGYEDKTIPPLHVDDFDEIMVVVKE